MPWIDRLLDYETIAATRQFFTRISSLVYQHTGIRFHPAVWQMAVVLALVYGAYWVYAAHRGARS